MHRRRITSMLGAIAALTACERPLEPDLPAEGAVVMSMHDVASWGMPVSVDPGGLNHLNTSALEGCPIESPDGRSLFFASNRDGQIDIWVSHRDAAGAWHGPEKLPAPVNSSFNDFCPTPLPGGVLFFVSTRPAPAGCGGANIYEARLHPTLGWLEPELLPCGVVNSTGNEFSPSVVAAGGGMLFFSSNRTGLDNIYVSRRDRDGEWGPSTLVDELNFVGSGTVRPNVSVDGRTIVFDSDRPDPDAQGGPDIYLARRQSIHDPWGEPRNLGPAVNSAAGESRASLSRDGRRLYFGSTRPGFEGNSDIFVSIRH